MKSFLLALAALLWLAPPATADADVDLELVIAIDASSSIDIGEYALQLRGVAAGFRDPEVREAIRSGRHGRIAVCLIAWAEQKFSKLSTGWHVIASDADAEAFSVKIETLPRRQFGGTGIGEGLDFAMAAIRDNGLNGSRRVIDVSGDGRETRAEGVILLPQARAAAISAGITVNALAVVDEDLSLPEYYRDHLIAGDGSFVMIASDYFAFAQAMRRKLLREIEPRPDISATEPRSRPG